MSARDRILAIDVGTQSVRALVFDHAGALCARAQCAIEPPYHSPQPGFAEQDPERFWDTLLWACHALWAEQPGLAGRIAGLALTTQRATSVFLDAEDQPVWPVISWLDRRRAERVPKLDWPMRWAKLVPGAGSVLDELQRRAPSNWLAAHAPAQHRRIARACLLSGFLVHRLTGAWRDAVGAQVGYLPFDYRKRRWAAPGDWRWRALSLTPAQMPALVEPGGALGELTGAAGQALGLAPGLTLYAAAADKACEALGSGAVSPETACVSLGTTATVNTCRTRYREVERFMPAYPAALPGAYNDEIQIDRGFWLVSWFKQEFAADTRREAAARGRPAEALLDEAIAPIAPASDGLLVMPTWSAGARTPGPEARGAIDRKSVV